MSLTGEIPRSRINPLGPFLRTTDFHIAGNRIRHRTPESESGLAFRLARLQRNPTESAVANHKGSASAQVH